MSIYNRLFIGGQWVSPSTSNTIDVISPHTEEIIATVVVATSEDVDAAVIQARIAFDEGPWPRLDPADRLAVVERLAELYKQRRTEMAWLITSEIGAPITFSKRAQVALPSMLMSAFTHLAADYDWVEERPGLYGNDILIAKQPIGVVAAVVPWNMPQFLTIGKIVPALLAGCTVIVKPAPESPLDALLLAELTAEAGFPEGVFSVLPGGADVGQALVAHRGVDKVSFTGSTAAGRSVAQACAAGLKPASLELGGKSAAIVLDDADPAATATAVRLASLANSGQVCNALTRILVPFRRKDDFIDALATELTGLAVGDPHDPATELGPLVSARHHERVRSYIEAGRRDGARLVVGGPDRPKSLKEGWYVNPTLFYSANNDIAIAREEVFGPVLTVIPYDDEDDAVYIANDSDYGLAGAVFTTDSQRGLNIAQRVRSGSFGVNQGYIMDPLAPFGGIKQSGYGRELGREGFESYLFSQSISCEQTS